MLGRCNTRHVEKHRVMAISADLLPVRVSPTRGGYRPIPLVVETLSEVGGMAPRTCCARKPPSIVNGISGK
jgi:hypothetical protein